jgi:RNA polymerase sigma factor (sigma-70 family)
VENKAAASFSFLWKELKMVHNDLELVDLARLGDQTAFGELVRRHRAKAYSWAQTIVKDNHLADDIVQEALIKAFLRLGTLDHASKFIPWLKRIVFNQSMMKVRRGGQYSKETPVSSYVFEFDQQEESFDISDLLQQVTIKLSNDHLVSQTNPVAVLLQKESMETIQRVISCLHSRERAIFTAYFFEQLSAQEISQQYDLSMNHVHMMLTRSKRKLQKERLGYMLDQYLISRSIGTNSLLRNVLDKPRLTCDSWTSSAACMQIVLEYKEMVFSLLDIMGYTSLAFRINIFDGSINVAGPHIYDWRDIHTRGLSNLGIQVRCFGSSVNRDQTPDAIIEALQFIHRNIDSGHPVMTWDMFIPEFGLIYGYDDHNKVLHAMDTNNLNGKKTVPYSHLSLGLFDDLYLMEVIGYTPVDENEGLIRALEMILEHAYQQENYDYAVSSDLTSTSIRADISFITSIGSINGLAAYDVWIRTFENRQVEVLGNAYNTEIISEAREYAAQFLLKIANTASKVTLANLAQVASAHYQKVADSFIIMRQMFPFPSGGNPNSGAESSKAIVALKRAKEEETLGLDKLKEMYDYLVLRRIRTNKLEE